MTPHDFIARWNGADDQARSRKTQPGLLAARRRWRKNTRTGPTARLDAYSRWTLITPRVTI